MSNEKFEYFGVYYKKDVPKLGEKKFRIFLDIKRFDIAQTEPDLMVIMMNPGDSEPISCNYTDDGYYSSQEDARNEIISNIDDLESIWEDVDPDKTQDQIMAVMNSVKDTNGDYRFNYARVLNLSDYCDSKSGSFIEKIADLNKMKLCKHKEQEKNNNIKPFEHSIFNREDLDLAILFKKNVPVILGWGLNEKLSALSTKAMQFFEKIQLNNTVEKIKTYPALKDKLSYDDVEIIKAILKEEKNKNIFKLPESYFPTRHPYPRGNQERQKKWLDDIVALLNERI